MGVGLRQRCLPGLLVIYLALLQNSPGPGPLPSHTPPAHKYITRIQNDTTDTASFASGKRPPTVATTPRLSSTPRENLYPECVEVMSTEL